MDMKQTMILAKKLPMEKSLTNIIAKKTIQAMVALALMLILKLMPAMELILALVMYMEQSLATKLMMIISRKQPKEKSLANIPDTKRNSGYGGSGTDADHENDTGIRCGYGTKPGHETYADNRKKTANKYPSKKARIQAFFKREQI